MDQYPKEHQDFPPPPPAAGAGQTHPNPWADTQPPPYPTAPEMATQLDSFPAPPAIPQPEYQQHQVPVAAGSQVPTLPPSQPERHHDQHAFTSDGYSPPPAAGPHVQDLHEYSQPPPMPPRPSQQGAQIPSGLAPYDPSTFQKGVYTPPPPPRRISQNFGEDDPSNPIHYTRDPHKLVAYVVPLPKPQIKDVDPARIPDRFLLYTPPPPPLAKPKEGEKEAKAHKLQRKWQEEVRNAKTSTAKTASWQGVKSKATRGISKAMSYTTTSSLDFLGRAGGGKSDSEDDVKEGNEVHKTVGVEEMILVYPSTMGIGQDQMREEFVNTMLRTKSKAQKDAILATGLMPVAFGIDVLATLIWPFGGLVEIDGVWAYASIRGAKTARSVTKRLSSSSNSGGHEKDQLRLNFTPSARVEVLKRYLIAECHKTDSKLFPGYQSPPTESDVLEAIGWNPHQSGGESRNWEDEQWEMTEVKDDLKTVMHKGAREWDKWCKAFEKNPEKAMKK